jgi:hypothetical protein
MKTTTMFAFAALAAASLRAGNAMAQSEGHDSGVPYWTLARQADALRVAQARTSSQVMAGSSDAKTMRLRIGHTMPFNGDYTTLANPGGSQ